jgi:hypothetical protein
MIAASPPCPPPPGPVLMALTVSHVCIICLVSDGLQLTQATKVQLLCKHRCRGGTVTIDSNSSVCFNIACVI